MGLMFEEEESDQPLPKEAEGVSMQIGGDPEFRYMQLQGVMQAALMGELAQHRPLKYWENSKLRPQHMQIVLMRAAGFKNKQIATQFGLTESRVSVICNHPDAQTLLAAVVSMAADNVVDIKTRIRAHAGEMLDHIVQTTRTTKNEKLRSDNSFKLLAMAGYGAVEKKEISHTLNMPAQSAGLIGQALEESSRLDEIDTAEYDDITQVTPEGDESGQIAAAGLPAPASEPPTSGPLRASSDTRVA